MTIELIELIELIEWRANVVLNDDKAIELIEWRVNVKLDLRAIELFDKMANVLIQLIELKAKVLND